MLGWKIFLWRVLFGILGTFRTTFLLGDSWDFETDVFLFCLRTEKPFFVGEIGSIS